MIYFNNQKNNKVNKNDRLLHFNNHKQRKHSIFNEAIIWIDGSKDSNDYKKAAGNTQRLKKKKAFLTHKKKKIC